MARNTGDRRVRKTAASVNNALSELLSKKPLEEITVTELCRKADINRSTFYLHYDTVKDCFEKVIYKMTDELLDLIRANTSGAVTTTREALNGYFGFIRDHKPLFRELMKEPLSSPLINTMNDGVNEMTKGNGFSRPAMEFFVAGFISSVTIWINSNYKDPDPTGSFINILTEIQQKMDIF